MARNTYFLKTRNLACASIYPGFLLKFLTRGPKYCIIHHSSYLCDLRGVNGGIVVVCDVLDVRQDGKAVLDLPAHRVPLTREAREQYCGFVPGGRGIKAIDGIGLLGYS